MARFYNAGEKIEKRKPISYTPVTETYNPLAYLAKAPTYLYQMLRSNPLVDPNSPIAQGMSQGWPELAEKYKESGAQALQQSLYASPEKARQEASNVLPDVMTRPLSQDWFAETVLREALAAGKNLSTPKGAALSALSSAVGYGLPAAGQALGYPEIGKALGAAGSAVIPHLPTMYANEHGHEMPKKRAQREYEESRMKLPKEMESLEKAKRQKIEQQQNVIKEHEGKIKSLETKRSKLYEKARSLEGGKIADASAVRQTLSDEGPMVFAGLNPMHRVVLEQLDKTLGANPKLSLADAKYYKEYINSAIYKKGTPKPIKRGLQKINSKLRDFINETGSPEHTKAYNSADKNSIKMYEHIDNVKSVIKEANQKIREIKSENISPVRRQELKLSEQQAKQTVDKEKLSMFEKVKNQLTPASMTIIGALTGAAGLPSSYKSLGALAGGALAYGIHNEQKILADIQKNNPKLYQQFIKDINSATPANVGRIVNRLNALSDKTQVPTQQPEKKKKKAGFY
jgi:hypothetical protein